MSKIREAKVAEILLKIGAVSLSPSEPFTWSSGLKTPIYCDNRLIMSYPEARDLIESSLIELIKEKHPDVDLIAGTATAGIPHAAIIADRMDLPMIYVRSSEKGHGKQNAIEGQIQPGQKVVMVEDLISTGGSVIEAAVKVNEAGGQVIGAVAIFSYGLEAGVKRFEAESYPLSTLTNYPTLVDIAVEDEGLKEYEATLKEWYKNPEEWSNSVTKNQ